MSPHYYFVQVNWRQNSLLHLVGRTNHERFELGEGGPNFDRVVMEARRLFRVTMERGLVFGLSPQDKDSGRISEGFE